MGKLSKSNPAFSLKLRARNYELEVRNLKLHVHVEDEERDVGDGVAGALLSGLTVANSG